MSSSYLNPLAPTSKHLDILLPLTTAPFPIIITQYLAGEQCKTVVTSPPPLEDPHHT